MKKALFILIVVALLGILAATVAPSPLQKVSSTTSIAPSTPTVSSSAAPSNTTPTTATTNSAQYKDGTYTGSTASNYYDQIQVAVVVAGGKITKISTPVLNGDSGRSQEINSYAVPQLTQEALSNQSSQIDGVSGASYTTQAYTDSLQSALDQAKA